MDSIKKILGFVWIVLAAAMLYYGLTTMGIPKLTSGNPIADLRRWYGCIWVVRIKR